MQPAEAEFIFKDNRAFLKGEVTAKTVPRLWRAYLRWVKTMKNQTLTIDLSDLNRVDTAALALLLSLSKDLSRQGKSLQFHDIPDKMLALAKVGGVATFLFSTH